MFVSLSSVKFVSSPPSLPPTHTHNPTFRQLPDRPRSLHCSPRRRKRVLPPKKERRFPKSLFAEWALLAAVVCTNSTGLSPPSPPTTLRTKAPPFFLLLIVGGPSSLFGKASRSLISPLFLCVFRVSARLVHGCACGGGGARQYWLSEGV